MRSVIIICWIIIFSFFNIGLSQSFELINTINEAIPRHECGFVACEGKLYLLGGRGIKPVERFDPQTKTWTKLSKTPLEIHHFQPVSYDGKIYIVGALTGAYPHEDPVANIITYDPEKDVWKTGPAIPENRRRGAAAVVIVRDKLYLIGGIKDGHSSGTVNWLDVYDLKTGKWQQLPDAPNRRDHLSAVSDGDYIYVLGGRRSDHHEQDNFTAFFKTTQHAVDRYHLKTQQWVTLPDSLPVASAGGGTAYYDGRIFYTGGESAQKTAHGEVQVYDPEAGEWTISGRLDQGRHGTSLTRIGNVLFIAAGSANQGGGPELSSIEFFEVE